MKKMTNWGKQVSNEVSKWDTIYRYYDSMTGCVLIPEAKYTNDSELQKQAVEFLKTADSCGRDNRWALEYVKGYDDDAPELGNESWFVSLRIVDAWC